MRTRREACVVFGGAAAVFATASGWASAGHAAAGGGDGLERIAPHRAGVDPDAVLAFLDDMAAAGLELNSFMLHRAGGVAAEGWWWPYRPGLPHMLHSATKSFTGTGIGIALAEGLVALDDPVLKFFPGRVRDPSPNLQAMTVESLLSQTCGHAFGVSGSAWRPLRTSWVDAFFRIPVAYPPGIHFAYSSATSYMLSAILTQVTGTSLDDYLRPRLFEPMGMQGVRWDVGPENINPGGNGLSATSADFLKLGLVHLAGGDWRGRQLIPKSWTQAVTTAKRSPDYSYQWWVAPNGLGYFAAGKFGQFCFVFPDLDMVLTLTAGLADIAETRTLAHALAFKHAPRMGARTAARPGSEAALGRRVRSLRALPHFSPQTSPLAERISGRPFACAPNDDGAQAVRLSFAGDRCQFELTDARGVHVVVNGLRDWLEGETTLTGGYLHHEYEPGRMRVAAGGRWAAPNRFDMTWQFVESGFRDTASLTFDGDTVRYDRGVNVNSGPLRRPSIEGHAAA